MKICILLLMFFLNINFANSKKLLPFEIFLNSQEAKAYTVTLAKPNSSKDVNKNQMQSLFYKVCQASDVLINKMIFSQLPLSMTRDIEGQLKRGVESAKLLNKNVKKNQRSIKSLNNFYEHFCKRYIKNPKKILKENKKVN